MMVSGMSEQTPVPPIEKLVETVSAAAREASAAAIKAQAAVVQAEQFVDKIQKESDKIDADRRFHKNTTIAGLGLSCLAFVGLIIQSLLLSRQIEDARQGMGIAHSQLKISEQQAKSTSALEAFTIVEKLRNDILDIQRISGAKSWKASSRRSSATCARQRRS